MNKIKIRDKEYNCSNMVYWHIKGLESENKLFSMEIKGHEQCEINLQQRIDKAINKLTLKQVRMINEEDYNIMPSDLDEIKDILRGEE